MIYTLAVIFYITLLIGIGIYKSRKVTTHDDFMVAGRSVPVFVLVSTLIATWIGSGSLFGTAGLTFRTGFSELWFSAGAWLGILLIYFIASRVRKISQYTLTDLLEKRYNRTARLIGTIIIVTAYMVIAGYQFKGGGRLISILSQGSISPETGMIIAGIVIIIITAVAGMVSIVSVDIFNGTIMILAMIITLPLAVLSYGGWENVIATINEKNPTHLAIFGSNDWIWALGVLLPTFLLLMSESSMYQKFSSAKDEASAKKAVIGMLLGVILVETLMCTIAVVGYAIYSSDSRFFFADGSINRAMSEEIILRIGFEKIPPIAGAFLLAAGVAIILSTGNTFLIVTSTNLTRDIYQTFINPNAEEKRIIFIQRIFIVLFGILAYLLVTQFKTILEMAFISYTMIGASLTPAILSAFLWKRVTTAGGVASILGGMITTTLITIINKVLESNNSTSEILGVHFPLDTDYIAIPAVIVSVLTLIIVSLLTKPDDESKWKPFVEK
jgi:SSS family solute:Na+ symporter/sodium/proline symporter